SDLATEGGAGDGCGGTAAGVGGVGGSRRADSTGAGVVTGAGGGGCGAGSGAGSLTTGRGAGACVAALAGCRALVACASRAGRPNESAVSQSSRIPRTVCPAVILRSAVLTCSIAVPKGTPAVV